MAGIRAFGSTLKDGDDDESFNLLIGDVQRLAQRVAELRAEATALSSEIAALSGTYLSIANNLSDVASAASSRTNLGLGTVATRDATSIGALSGSTGLALNTGSAVSCGNSSLTLTSNATSADFSLLAQHSGGDQAYVATSNGRVMTVYALNGLTIASNSSSGFVNLTQVRQIGVEDASNSGNGLTTNVLAGGITFRFCRGVLTSFS